MSEDNRREEFSGEAQRNLSKLSGILELEFDKLKKRISLVSQCYFYPTSAGGERYEEFYDVNRLLQSERTTRNIDLRYFIDGNGESPCIELFYVADMVGGRHDITEMMQSGRWNEVLLVGQRPSVVHSEHVQIGHCLSRVHILSRLSDWSQAETLEQLARYVANVDARVTLYAKLKSALKVVQAPVTPSQSSPSKPFSPEPLQ